MTKRNYNIIAALLAAILLIPYTYQLEHNHAHAVSCHHGEDEKISSIREKCFICDFQYSAFIPADDPFVSEAVKWHDNFNIRYNSIFCSENSAFLFLLRAPPFPQTV